VVDVRLTLLPGIQHVAFSVLVAEQFVDTDELRVEDHDRMMFTWCVLAHRDATQLPAQLMYCLDNSVMDKPFPFVAQAPLRVVAVVHPHVTEPATLPVCLRVIVGRGNNLLIAHGDLPQRRVIDAVIVQGQGNTSRKQGEEKARQGIDEQTHACIIVVPMKPVRIFRHVACEGPAYLADLLESRQIPFELVAVDEGQSVPGSLDDISGLVFLGGNMSVNDPLPWIDEELEVIRRACEQDLPMLGICLGSQLISKALGASVMPGANGQEIGWHTVKVVPSAAALQWIGDLPESFMLFHWHGETFDLPTGAVPLLASRAYANQAYAIGNTLALQCHPEMTVESVREWLQRYEEDLAKGGEFNQPAARIEEDLERKVAMLQATAAVLLGGWIDRLGRVS
jgi:GMP synthase-like glutamine amidotransferase